MKKTLSLLLSLVLMLSLALPASAAETEYPTLEGGVTEIQSMATSSWTSIRRT